MSIRMERVASLLLRDLSRILADDFSGRMPTLVTVTSVRVTKDLAIAHVYVSVLGDDAAQRAADFRHLQEFTPQIRHALAQEIRHQVRIIPELRFHLDESLQESKHMESLFARIRAERAEREDGGDDESAEPDQAA